MMTSVSNDISCVQEFPYPQILKDLVDNIKYRDNWIFKLHDDLDRGQGSKGMTLVINVYEKNGYPKEKDHPRYMVSVNHYMIVPAAAYDKRSWQRWLFDQIGLVETHERMEHFTINDEHPYAPSHGPGNDPYLIREVGTETDVKTSFRGDIND